MEKHIDRKLLNLILKERQMLKLERELDNFMKVKKIVMVTIDIEAEH
jgi:hypothetical protein